MTRGDVVLHPRSTAPDLTGVTATPEPAGTVPPTLPLPRPAPDVPRHRAPEESRAAPEGGPRHRATRSADPTLRVADAVERVRPGRHAAPEDDLADADPETDPYAWLGFRFAPA